MSGISNLTTTILKTAFKAYSYDIKLSAFEWLKPRQHTLNTKWLCVPLK